MEHEIVSEENGIERDCLRFNRNARMTGLSLIIIIRQNVFVAIFVSTYRYILCSLFLSSGRRTTKQQTNWTRKIARVYFIIKNRNETIFHNFFFFFRKILPRPHFDLRLSPVYPRGTFTFIFDDGHPHSFFFHYIRPRPGVFHRFHLV